MAYEFYSNNPFNIRGVMLSPQKEDSNPPTGIIFLGTPANTGSNAALNSGTRSSIINTDGENTYSLRLFFDSVTEAKPEQGHAVVCAGYVPIGANYTEFTQLYSVDTQYTQGLLYLLQTPEEWAGVPVETL